MQSDGQESSVVKSAGSHTGVGAGAGAASVTELLRRQNKKKEKENVPMPTVEDMAVASRQCDEGASAEITLGSCEFAGNS